MKNKAPALPGSIYLLQPTGRQRHFSRPSYTGFSLIELLMVIVILTILLAGSLTAINSIMTGYNVTTNTDRVLSALNLARQDALALNSNVYVIFYQYGSPNQYRALQVLNPTFNSAGQVTSAVALTKPILLTGTTVVASSSSQSTLFNASTNPNVKQLSGSGLPTYPQLGTTSNLAFCFIPDGSTSLSVPASAASNPYLLVADVKTLPSSGLPTNYSLVQVNPINGVARVFRP